MSGSEGRRCDADCVESDSSKETCPTCQSIGRDIKVTRQKCYGEGWAGINGDPLRELDIQVAIKTHASSRPAAATCTARCRSITSTPPSAESSRRQALCAAEGATEPSRG